MLVLGFSDYAPQTERLAAALGAPHVIVTPHRFPDGESALTLPMTPPAHVVVCRALDHPNDKLVELLLCAHALRERGVTTLTLVAPYLCYMRQDTAFHPGEVVSQRVVGRFLADLFDAVVTVDPHLHRVATLSAAVPAKRAIAISAAPRIGAFLKEQLRNALLVGPDSESQQWVRHAAAITGWDFVVASKQRLGDRSVRVTLPDATYAKRTAVILDDMASTGHTLAETARALRKRGVSTVHVAVTHGLFVPGAVETLARAGITTWWTTDSVSAAANGIPLAEDLAAALKPPLL